MIRRTFLQKTGQGAVLATVDGLMPLVARQPVSAQPLLPPAPGYKDSFYLLHLDHHTRAEDEVGRDADPVETERLINLARPDLIQIHAKGNPGWTTYPSKVGYTPPNLKRDVQAVWRDIARKNGYTYFIYYNIGRDVEIMRRRPEWNRHDAQGQLRDRTLCYHTGVAEAYIWPMLTELLTAYQPDGFWFDGSAFTVETCYCTTCRDRFRREQQLEPPLTPDAPGWASFKEMHRQIYRDFIRATTALIRRQAPACQVAFNFAYCFNMPEPAASVDYLTHDTDNHAVALSKEAHYFDGTGKPFDLMTTVWLNDGKSTSLKPAGQIQQEMAIIIANGGRYFAWDNPTRQSGLVAERYVFQHEVIAPFLRERQAWCLGSTRLPTVSVLHSATDHYAATLADKQCFARADIRLQPLTDALTEAHLDYELITEDQLNRGVMNSRVLVINNPTVLSVANRKALRRFVRRGGHLIWIGPSSVESDVVALLGLRRTEPVAGALPLTVSLDGKSVEVPYAGHLVEPTHARISLSATDSAGVRPSGRVYPLLTEHRLGRGRVHCVPLPLFATYQPVAGGRLATYLFETMLPASARRLTTDAPATVEVVLRQKADAQIVHFVNRATGQREELKRQYGLPYYRITDIPPVNPSRVSVGLPDKPASVRVVPGNNALTDWTFADGQLVVNVPGFAIHQMIVIT